jgi:hypothetical protein
MSKKLPYVDRAKKMLPLEVKLGRIVSENVHYTGRDDSLNGTAYMCVRFITYNGEYVYMDTTGTQFPVNHELDTGEYIVNTNEGDIRFRVWDGELDDNATAYWEITELNSDELEYDPSENHFYRIVLYNKEDQAVGDWYIDYTKPIDIEYQRCSIAY